MLKNRHNILRRLTGPLDPPGIFPFFPTSSAPLPIKVSLCALFTREKVSSTYFQHFLGVHVDLWTWREGLHLATYLSLMNENFHGATATAEYHSPAKFFWFWPASSSVSQLIRELWVSLSSEITTVFPHHVRIFCTFKILGFFKRIFVKKFY